MKILAAPTQMIIAAQISAPMMIKRPIKKFELLTDIKPLFVRGNRPLA